MATDPSSTFSFLSVPALRSVIYFFTFEQFIYYKNFMGCVLEKKRFVTLIKDHRQTLFKGGSYSGVFVVEGERD